MSAHPTQEGSPPLSTIFHRQTPFTEHRAQVEVLCNSLWPASRLVIERLHGGAYSGMVRVKVRSEESSGNSGHEEQLILRAPKHAWEADLKTEVATLLYLRQHAADIPIPHIKAFDLTDNNPLNSLYSVQTRLPGVSLREVYPKLSHNQNIVLVKEVCKIILALQAVTQPFPGLIQLKSSDGAGSGFSVRPIEFKSTFATGWTERPQEMLKWEPKADDAYDFFTVQFGRRLAQELLRDPRRIACEDYQTRFMEAARQMNDMGIFKGQGNCLCHLGLYARNILVLPGDEHDTVQVTGVLGWDSAVVAPKFGSCAMPWWLWQCDPDENGSTWEELDGALTAAEPDSPQALKLMITFAEAVGDDFMKSALKPQLRLARQLFRFAVGGLQCNEDYSAADQFLRAWKEFYDDWIKEAEGDGEGSEGRSETGAKQEALNHDFKQAQRSTGNVATTLCSRVGETTSLKN